MRISDWSSDVCSSDLKGGPGEQPFGAVGQHPQAGPDDGSAHHSGDAEPQQLHPAIDAHQRPVDMRHQPTIGTIATAQPMIVHGAENRMRPGEIGSAACRDRVCQYVYVSGVAESSKKKKKK